MPKQKKMKSTPHFALPVELIEIILSFSKKHDSLNFSQTNSLIRSTFWNSHYSLFYRLKKETNEIIEQNPFLTAEKHLENIQELLEYQQNRIDCIKAKNLVLKRFQNWNAKQFMSKSLPEINSKEMQVFQRILENTHYTLRKVNHADYISISEVNWYINTENEKLDFRYDGYDDEGCNPRWSVYQNPSLALESADDEFSIDFEVLKSLREKLNLNDFSMEKIVFFLWKLIPYDDDKNFCFFDKSQVRDLIEKSELEEE
jgi:hypothetical protein